MENIFCPFLASKP